MRQVSVTALAAFVVSAALALSSCRVDRPPVGGEIEQDLAAATAALDVARVRQLLASGADPNKMVKYEGLYHAPWEIALKQVRPRRPELVEIVHIMLKAGANPERAWGESVARGITRRYPREPMMLAMLHPEPDVVRALMEAGLNPRHGQTALVMAIESGDVDVAYVLVDAGVDVNCHPGALTPLVAAIEARNVALMTYLEAHGAREKP